MSQRQLGLPGSQQLVEPRSHGGVFSSFQAGHVYGVKADVMLREAQSWGTKGFIRAPQYCTTCIIQINLYLLLTRV